MAAPNQPSMEVPLLTKPAIYESGVACLFVLSLPLCTGPGLQTNTGTDPRPLALSQKPLQALKSSPTRQSSGQDLLSWLTHRLEHRRGRTGLLSLGAKLFMTSIRKLCIRPHKEIMYLLGKGLIYVPHGTCLETFDNKQICRLNSIFTFFAL